MKTNVSKIGKSVMNAGLTAGATVCVANSTMFKGIAKAAEAVSDVSLKGAAKCYEKRDNIDYAIALEKANRAGNAQLVAILKASQKVNNATVKPISEKVSSIKAENAKKRAEKDAERMEVLLEEAGLEMLRRGYSITSPDGKTVSAK